jgi:hypothetical protein
MEDDMGTEILYGSNDGIVTDVDGVEFHTTTPASLSEMVGVSAAEVIEDQHVPSLVDEQVDEG